MEVKSRCPGERACWLGGGFGLVSIGTVWRFCRDTSGVESLAQRTVARFSCRLGHRTKSPGCCKSLQHRSNAGIQGTMAMTKLNLLSMEMANCETYRFPDRPESQKPD
jgi:hypothetical protein